MNEENKNSISYANDWKNVSDSEYVTNENTYNYDDEEDNDNISEDNESPENNQNKNHYNKQIVVTVQLIVCIIIAIAAFVLKNFGGEIYHNVHDWYYNQLSQSVIIEDENGGYKINSNFVTATDDETENTKY